jgi:hypothetical protein
MKTPHSDPNKRWVARPIIPVTLFGPKGEVHVYALLDSGADRCLFNLEIANEIGVDLRTGEKEKGFGIEGHGIDIFVHKIRLQVKDIDKKIEVSAGFSDAPGIVPILGQEGFFDNFRIKFEKDHDSVEITPIK